MLARGIRFDRMGLGRVELPTSRLSGRKLRTACVTLHHHRPPFANNLLSMRESPAQFVHLRTQIARSNGHHIPPVGGVDDRRCSFDRRLHPTAVVKGESCAAARTCCAR